MAKSCFGMPTAAALVRQDWYGLIRPLALQEQLAQLVSRAQLVRPAQLVRLAQLVWLAQLA
jgi:hypothetical protein